MSDTAVTAPPIDTSPTDRTTARPAARPKPANALLLPQPEVWRYLGLSRSTWFRLKAAGKVPRPVTVPGSAPRWRRKDLEVWVERLRYARPAACRRRLGPADGDLPGNPPVNNE